MRLGLDYGGTKIEAAVLAEDGRFLVRRRLPNPGGYEASIDTVRALVDQTEAEAGVRGLPIGVGMPGSISPATGKVRNANSTWLNDRPFDADLAAALARPVRVANDANCFALSEATDGAGQGGAAVFGAILGTGCGGGVVVDGRLLTGANGIGGEWGHTPLPWPSAEEARTDPCWCGRTGCLETWISGTGFCLDYQRATGARLRGDEIVARARRGEAEAAATFDRYIDRLARALAVVCDLLDPDVIVCGGGMSNVPEIYPRIGAAIAVHAFTDTFVTRVAPARHGDSSGVRGAAWLWPPA